MPTYIRYATRAQKVVVKLDDPHERRLIGKNIVAATILDKGTGTFKLTFIFPDRTELELDQDEVLNGDSFSWDIEELLITNKAQAGVTLKLLLDFQILPK